MSTYLSAERIRELEAILGYEFNDKSLLEKSLQSAGFGPHPEGHKRLALIGDAALRLILYLGGYETDASTQDMTELQNTRGTNLYLAQNGFAKGINEFILLNPSLRGLVPQRVIATTMEAILGAVYLDSQKDIDAVFRVAVHLGLINDA